MFSRTEGGERNRPIFLDYQLLVIIEANEATVVNRSTEAKFWSELVAKFIPNTTFRLSLASNKTNALAKARQLQSVEGIRYVCCIDKDIENLSEDPAIQIVTTKNYSYEADLVYSRSLAEVYELTIGGVTDAEKDKQDIENILNEIMDDCKSGVLADVVCLQKGLGFFDRHTEESFVRVFNGKKYGEKPKFCRVKARERILEIRAIATEKARVTKMNFAEHCYGKLVLWIGYKTVCHKLAAGNNAKLSKQLFRNLLMGVVSHHIRFDNFEFKDHYATQFSRLRSA